MSTEKCSCCNEILDSSKFKKYSTKTNGSWYHSSCKECESKQLLLENWKENLLKCHICGEFLSEDSFQKHKNYSYRNYRDKRCTKCKGLQNKEARLKYTDDQKFDKVFLNRIHGVYQRSKDKNLECNIDLEYIKNLWIFQNGRCAISSINMTYTLDEGRSFSNVSIDRINSNLGYIKENIQLVCMSINQLKSDFDMETVYLICNSIIKNKKYEI